MFEYQKNPDILHRYQRKICVSCYNLCHNYCKKNVIVLGKNIKINYFEYRQNFIKNGQLEITTCVNLQVFLAFDFCRFCVAIRFFIPPQWLMTSDFEGYLCQILSITFFASESQYFPFLMFSAKQGNYWYHFYNAFGAFLEEISHSIFCCICIFFAKSLFF